MEIEKSELEIVPFNRQMTVLEIPQDDLDRVGGLSDVLAKVIVKCKDRNATPITIYSYFVQFSCNFLEPCDSMLLGICGNPPLAQCIELVLRDVYNLNVRIESSMPYDGASCAYHFEGGKLWESMDSESFCSIEQFTSECKGPTDSEIANLIDGENTLDDDTEEDSPSNNLIARRTYRARSDSSISSLISSISRTYGIPEDSIKIVNPNGNQLRLNSTVGRLRSIWEQ